MFGLALAVDTHKKQGRVWIGLSGRYLQETRSCLDWP